jgi:sn-glycerol 3-phosphate transport system permease protein
MKVLKNVECKLIFRILKPYIMIAPSIAIFSVFMVYPIFYMIYLSFYKWDMLGDKAFIGVKNYITMFKNPDFLRVVGNSFQYMGLTVVSTIVLALLLAIYLRRDTRVNALLQSAIFAPYVISFVSVSFIWMWMMDSSYGLFNFILKLFHMSSVRWLEDPKVAMYSLVLVAIWKGIGYNTIIFISGLQRIPQYLYEAADLDKAKPVSVFFKITLPMLSPTLFFLTLINIISSFKVFETISIMTKGGPMNATNTLVYYIYEYGFVYYKIGYASAVGVVLMLIIGILTIFYFKILSTKVYYR